MTGLPIVMGSSFAFVPTILPLAQSLGLAAVFGAVFVGGLATTAVGFGLRWLRRLFPPVVTGTYIITLGIVLVPVAFSYMTGSVGTNASGSAGNLLLATLVIVVTVTLHHCFSGVVSNLSVLLGIATGYVVAAANGMVDFSSIESVAWLQAPSLFEFGIEFHPVAILGIVVMATAVCAAEVGNITGTTVGAFERDATPTELSRGVVASGVASSFAAAFNGFSQTSFSQNVGLVAMTGNGSRYTTALAGLMLLSCGLIPKLGFMVATIPQAALGGALVIVFGLIIGVGLKILSQVELDKRAMTIIGTSVAVAVGLRFDDTQSLAGIDPGFGAALASGIIPGTLVSIGLNLWLPRPSARHTATRRPRRQWC